MLMLISEQEECKQKRIKRKQNPQWTEKSQNVSRERETNKHSHKIEMERSVVESKISFMKGGGK